MVGAYRPCTGASDGAGCGVAVLEVMLFGLVPFELSAECPLDEEQLLTVRASAAMPTRLAPRRRRTGSRQAPSSFRWSGPGREITSSGALPSFQDLTL